MKRVFLSSILAFLVFNLNSQTDEKFTGGMYISPIISWLKPIKNIESVKSRLSFGVGATADVNMTNNFSLNFGLSFNNVGGTVKYKYEVLNFKCVDTTYNLVSKLPNNKDTIYHLTIKAYDNIKYKLQYLEVPIAIRGVTPYIGNWKFFLKCGISPKIRYKSLCEISIDSQEEVEEFYFFNFGYLIGTGFFYKLAGNTKLLIEFVFRNGLTDTEKVKININNPYNYKLILNYVDLRLGILF